MFKLWELRILREDFKINSSLAWNLEEKEQTIYSISNKPIRHISATYGKVETNHYVETKHNRAAHYFTEFHRQCGWRIKHYTVLDFSVHEDIRR